VAQLLGGVEPATGRVLLGGVERPKGAVALPGTGAAGEETPGVDQEARKTLTDVLTCLRELLRQIDAGEIVADDGQRAYLEGALETAESMAAEHARGNAYG